MTQHVPRPVATALVAIAIALTPLAAHAAAVGDLAPAVSLNGPQGAVSLAAGAAQGEWTYLDFWASWCGPCKESFPVMEDLHKKYGEKGFVILAVNVDENAAAMKDFLKEHAASFTIVHDATKKLVGTANISSMPTSFMLDKEGKIAAIHKGFHGKDTVKQYEAEIEKLLGTEVAKK